MSRIERMAEKVATTRLSAIHTYKVGDIFFSSWGYDQTNISWYQVTGVTEKAVRVREIMGKIVGGSAGTDNVVPVPNEWDPHGKEQIKIVNPRGSLKMTSYAYAYPWDGHPKSQTAFGYGH